MRILHLVHQYPPEHVGGTELYTQALARGLTARGHDVSVFYPRVAAAPSLERRVEAGVQVLAAGTEAHGPTARFLATFYMPGMVALFCDAVRDIRPDLVHVQHLMGLPAEILRPLRQEAIPYVATLHDYWWVCANAQLLTNDSQQICPGPDRWFNCARCALARGGAPGLLKQITTPLLVPMMAARGQRLQGILSEAACLIAPARFVREWYIAHGFAADRICLLPHGIQGPAQPAQQRERQRVRFVYIGGLAWQKGVHVVVRAFSQLHGPAELWIAGDESADPQYVASLRAISNDNSIRYLGALSRADVWDTLSQADVLVVPSLWYETFSLITHEAFAAGLPVVASRLGVLADAVRDDVDGLLVNVGDVSAWRDTLQRVIDDPALLARLRCAVRPPMPQEEHVRRVEMIYEQTLGGRASGPTPCPPALVP